MDKRNEIYEAFTHPLNEFFETGVKPEEMRPRPHWSSLSVIELCQCLRNGDVVVDDELQATIRTLANLVKNEHVDVKTEESFEQVHQITQALHESPGLTAMVRDMQEASRQVHQITQALHESRG